MLRLTLWWTCQPLEPFQCHVGVICPSGMTHGVQSHNKLEALDWLKWLGVHCAEMSIASHSCECACKQTAKVEPHMLVAALAVLYAETQYSCPKNLSFYNHHMLQNNKLMWLHESAKARDAPASPWHQLVQQKANKKGRYKNCSTLEALPLPPLPFEWWKHIVAHRSSHCLNFRILCKDELGGPTSKLGTAMTGMTVKQTK